MQKSNEHQIDQIFGEAFRNADADFDKDSMWTEMQSSLPNRNDRILFWTSLGTGILLCIYFVFLLGGRTELNTTPATLSQSDPTIPEQSENNSTKGTVATPISSDDPKERTKSEHTTVTDDEDHPTTNEAQNASRSTESENSVERTIDLERNRKDRKASITSTTPQLKTMDATGKTSTSIGLHSDKTLSILKENESGLNTDYELNRLALLPLTPIDQETKLTYKDPKWSQCDVGGRPPKFFADLYGFGAYPLIENSLNPDPENQSNRFLKEWNESESPVGSYAFGLMLGMGTNWGGSISAGLEFQQVINKLNKEQTVIERITVYDEMAYFYLDSNNNKVWVADSVTSTRIYKREIQMEKKHTLVNVPVTLGYHLERGQWRFGLTAGINLHIYKKFDGKVLDPSGQIIDASTGSNFEVYDTDMSFSIMGGIDLGYMMNDHLEFYISPRIRYHSDSWLDESHPLESHIQLIGLRGGTRYHF